MVSGNISLRWVSEVNDYIICAYYIILSCHVCKLGMSALLTGAAALYRRVNKLQSQSRLPATCWEIVWKLFFECGQGQDNLQHCWVPYHKRIRLFFERWPGAMKA